MIKFEMKSRESQFIFDSNIYSMENPPLKMGFRTNIILNEDDSFLIKNSDQLGQSCEIFMNLKDYNVSREEFINSVKEIEGKYNPENLTSAESVKDFLKKVK